jgi:hypothetical protein
MEQSADPTPEQQLLASFNATCLGEGDTSAGANLLVAMAVTLANLARPGSGIVTPCLGHLRAGASLLASGSLTAPLVRDHVVAEATARQNNLAAHLRRFRDAKIADEKKRTSRGIGSALIPEPPRCSLFDLEIDYPFLTGEQSAPWSKAVARLHDPVLDELADRPRLLVTARGHRDLAGQLERLHENRALVVLGLACPADVPALAETCDALLDGLYPCGDPGETATANLLVTAPAEVLARAIANPVGQAAWPARMTWLVDGDAGPDATEAGAIEGIVRTLNMVGRFGEALTRAFARRLDIHHPTPTAHAFDLAHAQIRWARFLQEMERHIPGVTGAARGLLATLAFGLVELADAPGCRPLTVTPAGVEGLARRVILRMARARAAIRDSARQDGHHHHARRILCKLGDGALPERAIYRALTMRAGLCQELLLTLRSAGLVRRVGHRWELAKENLPAEAETRHLFLAAS